MTARDTERQNRLLRGIASAERRFCDAILEGGGPGEIVALLNSITGRPSVLYQGVHGRLVCSSGASVLSGPHLATPVEVLGERWGWLVVFAHPTPLAALDDCLSRSAARHIALELVGRRRWGAGSGGGRAVLARELLMGSSSDDDLRRHAVDLGVVADARRIVAHIDDGSAQVDAHAIAGFLVRAVGAEVLAARTRDGLTLLIEVDSDEAPTRAVRRVRRDVHAALESVCRRPQVAGLSPVCRSLAELPAAFRTAREVAHRAGSPGRSGHRVATADDFGPARMFIVDCQPAELASFASDILKELLDEDGARAELVTTLEVYVATGCSARLASERLAVHENTVRYRLSRVKDLTGLDVVGDADDQMSVQVALLARRLAAAPPRPGRHNPSSRSALP